MEQEWVGAANYVELLTADKLYVKSLGVTTYYSLLAIPTSIVVTYSVALLLNQKVRGWPRTGLFGTCPQSSR